jgi:nucleotide-binding universal stress UspA family protein
MVRAADVAHQFDAEVHLLHVVMMVEPALYPAFALPPDTTEAREELTQAAERQLRESAKELGILTEKTVVAIRHASAIAPAILDYADETEVDLIGMGTHGRRGVRRFLMGSVAEEVVRKAPCPVLTYRPELESAIERPQKLVAAVDLSDHSLKVVQHAAELARLYHASVDFVHVLPQPHYPASYELGSGAGLYVDGPEASRRVKDAMVDLVREALGDTGDYHFHVLRGDAAQKLLAFAEENDSDLVVVASHGMTGLAHVLLGSVADKVVRQAECPVLTVHAFGRSWVEDVS